MFLQRKTPERHEFPIFGYLAEFENVDDLLGAVRGARASGYREMEAYTPLPVHELTEALGYKDRLPLIVLIGGITGALVGFGMQYWMTVIDYPLNIGGRPLNSWPSFIVVTFEMTILFAALSAVLGMLALNGLPQPYHPVFHIQNFELASRNRFFLLLLSRDPQFEMERAQEFLGEQPCLSVRGVPR